MMGARMPQSAERHGHRQGVLPAPPPARSGLQQTAALTDVLFAGRFDAVHAPWRALCDDESFRYPADAGPRERVNGSYRRLRMINDVLDSVEGLVNDVEGLAALHEWMCPVEGGLATVAGIHYNLFLGSLLDHDADDRRDLTPFITMRHTGIFLCTEVGHGNDAARLETTATYEPSTGGFVLHTPTPAAQKFMPNASTAGGPKAGLVAARLIHTGRDLGVFLFLTPLTDDRGALPGVRIRRLPDKIGYSVDHCLTAFDHVRLPLTRSWRANTGGSRQTAPSPVRWTSTGCGSCVRSTGSPRASSA